MNQDGCFPFVCKWMDCDFKTTKIWKLANHLKVVHSDKNNEKDIKLGNNLDAEISIKCKWDNCNYAAKQKEGSLNLAKAKFLLTSHLHSHICFKKLACPTCGQTFSTTAKFKAHFLRQLDEKDYQCQICSKTFATKELAHDHIRSHDRSRYKCQYCTYTSRVPSELKRHILYKHSDIRQYHCKQCEKSFKTFQDLQVHHYVQHMLLPDKETVFKVEILNIGS